MKESKIVSAEEIVLNDSGQSILEFILLLTIVLSLSIMLSGGLNGQIAKRWKILVSLISGPTETIIEVR
jgi:hypothetical protein